MASEKALRSRTTPCCGAIGAGNETGRTARKQGQGALSTLDAVLPGLCLGPSVPCPGPHSSLQQGNAREGPSERMLSVSITRPDLSHPSTTCSEGSALGLGGHSTLCASWDNSRIRCVATWPGS